MNQAGMSELHTPVMLDRVLELLRPALQRESAILVDGTLGMGGHSLKFLETFPKLQLIAIDRDPAALLIAKARLASYQDRVSYVPAVYADLSQILAEMQVSSVAAVLLDLGVSSLQLDQADRGFSYAVDAPLDMRMDPSQGSTAADILRDYTLAELIAVLQKWGEEKFAKQIAREIVKRRELTPLATSFELVELIREVIPAAARRTGGHPAKRTFQALRIEVNQEIIGLRKAIPAAIESLDVSGRLLVMSYQSLEDRIVKQEFANRIKSAAPLDLPVVPDKFQPKFKLVTKGAEMASPNEITSNPRAKSVRVRCLERRVA